MMPRRHLRTTPRPALIERYRSFVEGRTDGAGDPRELPLFCRDAAAVKPTTPRRVRKTNKAGPQTPPS
ncbi:MAG: hypothetical protein HQL98_10615 [Magnetococcales bacterium]|nr:hypothetical protein [Magnetococcales bacterium]